VVLNNWLLSSIQNEEEFKLLLPFEEEINYSLYDHDSSSLWVEGSLLLPIRLHSTPGLEYNFLARQPLKPWQVPINIGIMLVDVFIPILLMIYYIKAIDFQKYLMMLMKACELNQYYPNSSYFICRNSRDDLHGCNTAGNDSTWVFKEQGGLLESKTSDASSDDMMKRQLLHDTPSDFNQDSLTNGDGYMKVINSLIIGVPTTEESE
jgi:hypothetical protein